MLSGRVADRFVIEGVAGKGGMGTVYRAHDERTGQRVALKVIGDATPSARARFTREADALARVNHPGVVRFIAQGALATGEPYLVMDWVEGEDLATRLRRGAIDARAAFELARALANGLGALHAQGIVHRDLKPLNVLLAGGDTSRPVLVDLGLARQVQGTAMTATGSILGTPQYMSPEQIAGSRDLDHRADLFSLGCLLFEVLAGRAMFLGDNAMAVLAKIVVDRAPSLADVGVSVPATAEQLIASLVEKDPDQRPAAALDVAARLGTCLDALAKADASGPAATRVVTVHERRAVAVAMVTGLETGSDLLATATPEEAARDDDTLQGLVAEYDGQRWALGTGRILVTFSGAVEAADQAARAARWALALAAARPHAKIALGVGSAQVDRAPVGDVINRVAPLIDRARAGRVRVDADSASLLELRFRAEAHGPDFELTGELGSAEPPRTLLGRQTKCVGRERELTTLLGTLDEVVAEGVSRAALVTAPSGGGKSRVRHELAQRLQRRGTPAALFVARAEALRSDSPLDLLAGLIRAGVGIEGSDSAIDVRSKLVENVRRRIASEAERVDVAEFLGEIVGAQFPVESSPRLAMAREDTRLMGAQMMRAFVSWLDGECRHRPVVLVLEDLQWGDHQTVRFLDAALRDLAEKPFLVLALARPEVHQRFPGLWESRGMLEVRLGALSARSCEQLVREVLGDIDKSLVDQIVRRADGNAFYLEELVRGAAQGDLSTLPVSVLAMVQARLEALDAQLRRVLRAASVFGEKFHRAGTAALIGADNHEVARALDELVEREVLMRRDLEVEYAFRHALVREAAYAMLADADRRVAHGLAAQWLAANGETDALLLAQHFDRAQDMVNATRCFARASRQALDKNDHDGALGRANRAIDLGATGDVLGEARAVRGKAFAALGRFAEAEKELELALAAMLADAGEARLDVLRVMYTVATFRQSASTLRNAGNEVMTLAAKMGRPPLAVEARAALALADHADERCDTALQQFRATDATRHESPSILMGLSAMLLYHTSQHAESVAVNRHLLQVARDIDDAWALITILPDLGLSLAALGQYEEARACFAEGRAVARQRGLYTLEARTASMSAGPYLDIFDFAGATATAQETCDLGGKLEFSTPRVSALIDLAFVAVRTGNSARATELLDSIAQTVEKGTGWHGWLWRERTGVARGEIDLARGDYESALRRAEASIEETRRHKRLKYEASAQIVRAGARAALGDRDGAIADLATFLDEVGERETPTQLRVSAALLGHAPDARIRAIAERAAAKIEAGLPRSDQSGFRARVDRMLAT